MGQQSPNIYMTSTLSSFRRRFRTLPITWLLAGSRRISQRWQGAAFFWSIWTQMPSPGLSDYMESAGEASGAYQAAKVETQDKTWDSGQKFQQTMGEVTWVTGMPRLGES